MQTDDLCKLLDTTEENLIKILEERYLSNRIYTNAGIVLISINPYTNLNLYGKNIMNAYFNISSCDPHIYNICENAFQDMSISNQTIMISGESGSGKTENTKLLQDYLITRTGTNKDLKDKIDALTIILESFGNAKTILNDNSSRVGKMISYYIDDTIKGIKLKTFLLEKSRVTHQNEGECNFNIFYQLCKYKNLKIENDYINTNDNISKNYKNVKNALRSLGFENIDFIENILLVILYFGFMQFNYKNNKICINKMKFTKSILEILKIDENFLEDVLLKKEIRVNEEVLVKYNTIEEALIIRDSISRILYVKIFDFLVSKINDTLCTTSGPCINILDIFGFEVFKENSLDQLCINYANEKIQDDFIKKIFEVKQEEYKKELENYNFVPFNSNISLIEELERRCGLFDLIDEESKNKFGSTNNLRNKILSYIKNGIKIKSNDIIIVKHFIKDVEYNIKDFINKNREVKIDEKFFNKIFKEKFGNTTVLNDFLYSLRSLFNEINSTQIKYIRCIKPNNKKRNIFDKEVVHDQLVSTGILEVIKINQQIYTYEMNKEEWYKKYEKYKNILEGKTKIYFNSEVKVGIEISEKMRDDRKRKIMNWFMKELIKKKEGLNDPKYIIEKPIKNEKTISLKNISQAAISNVLKSINPFKSKENLPNIDIEKNNKKECIKFKDENVSTADIIMNTIFGEEEEEPKEEINVDMKKKDMKSDSGNVVNTITELKNLSSENIEATEINTTNFDTANIDAANFDTANIETANIDTANIDNSNLNKTKLERCNTKLEDLIIMNTGTTKIDEEDLENDTTNLVALKDTNTDTIKIDSINLDGHYASNIENHTLNQIISEDTNTDDIKINEEDLKNDTTNLVALKDTNTVNIKLDMINSDGRETIQENHSINSKDTNTDYIKINTVEELENISTNLEASENMNTLLKIDTVENSTLCDLPRLNRTNPCIIEISDLMDETQEKSSVPNQNFTSPTQCPNCANLELKYKFVSEALREANIKLSSPVINIIEPASTLFSRLFYLYLENIPTSGSVPRSEMLSFAHSAFLITKKSNKIQRESILIFIEEISLRSKYYEKSIPSLLFFLSNLVEYSKLVEDLRDLQDLIRKMFINLSDYYLEMIKDLIPSSITDHQELSNFKCNDSFIKKIFKPFTIQRLIKTLDIINNQIEFYYLDKEYKKSIINYILSNINTNIFNSIIIKNNFLSFNRCIQINYNLNQIYIWLNEIDAVESRDKFRHVMEIIKIVNMTYSSEVDLEDIKENCEILTSGQIRTLLMKMGYEQEIVREDIFISCEPLRFVDKIEKIEENFVVPRFVPSEEIKFVTE
ncbi:myosin [Vairimorpha necatrix]|uniref:Myosin n=1 Tax=Vairimorpha necatrix TaxID=6039 RepID=A0AAX4JAZ1_9MICR